MQRINVRHKKTSARLTSLLLCLAMLLPLLSAAPALSDRSAKAAELSAEQPVLVVTGQGIIPGGVYSKDNVSLEKSYTLDDLKALTGITHERLYSSINSSQTKRIYIGEGVDIAGLLSNSGYTAAPDSEIAAKTSDGKGEASFDANNPLNENRSYYPGVNSADDSNAVPVSAILAWSSAYKAAPDVPAQGDMKPADLLLLTGQRSVTDVNNSLFSKGVNKLQAGGAIAETALTVGGTPYTRADVLMMPRAQNSYTYTTKGGEQTDYARGVPLTHFAAGCADDEIISFTAADGYDMSSASITVAEARSGGYLLAYEKGDSAASLSGIYETAKSPGMEYGFFTLYAEGKTPAKMIDSITISPPPADSGSEYKHTASSSPYNIDALTGATLTVEGPGVKTTTPVTVRELESTDSANIHRGVYNDARDGGSASRTYEGITVKSLLNSMINTNIERLDDNVVVVFKNRWRQEIARLTYDQIDKAVSPVIIAYGTANADGTSPKPFVFTNATGEDAALGNGDGPLKLVFNLSEFPGLSGYTKFLSVAYLYIEEGVGAPGYKHSGDSAPEAYGNKQNTEYLLTFTGSALGREVSFTVEELEDMVTYGADNKPDAAGIGHRSEYSLSNTTYWYVSEYEGIKLWELLTGIGVDANTYKDDDSTLVSFSSWDNYQINTKFSMKQLANPDLFYFYEKSPLDIGTDRPTKAQLATSDYQPDNQGTGWDTDSNGYPVKKGYPVLLAYGVNGYPYVRNSTLDGFMSGLGNDGGPMRLIYGKTDGLNRDNPAAPENYAYFFNNGSNQLQRVQEIYIGDDVRYSTHLQNPDTAYQAMKDTPAALTVEIVGGANTTTHAFTLGELESILYGSGVSKKDRDAGRMEKGYYYYKNAGNGSKVQDLFEGINLDYLLTTHIGLQGTLGSVELYSGSDLKAVNNLSALSGGGYNSERGTEGLGAMVAFAKNGYPLVSGSGSDGYVSTDSVTGRTIKNSGGPLQFVRGQTAEEKAAGIITTDEENKTSVENLTKIVVRLDADVFAHVDGDYAAYASQNVKYSGAVSQESGLNLSVAALETKQRYMTTGEYTIGGETKTYRGLDLFNLLNDSAIGASALMSEITVKNAAGSEKTLTVADLTDSGKKIILAYGIAGVSGADPAGKPLVPDSGSSGYDAAYGNLGGPVRLIINGGTAEDCITNVTEIIVIKSSVSGWKHDFGNYAQYSGTTLEISGQNLKHNKTYTVAEIEAMDNIFTLDAYQIGGISTYVQGVELYKLLQNIGFAGDLDTSNFTAYASDGYATQFDGTQLKNGINGKPVLVAFGQGTTASNGLPLVPDTNSPGYDPNIGNAFGPLRLVVHDNSGWSVKYLAKIVVGAAGGNPDPSGGMAFTVYGLASGGAAYTTGDIKNLAGGTGTKTETYSYTSGGAQTDNVKGAYLSDILEALGVRASATVTVNTTDTYEDSQADYRDIPMSEIKSQKYFVAYEVNSAPVSDPEKNNESVIAEVRIYRNYNDGSNWRNCLKNIKSVTVSDYDFTAYLTGKNGFPNAGVRSISQGGGGLWAGTYGGGLVHLPSGGGTLTVYNTASTPALMTDFASAVAVDASGGVWFSQNASYTNPGDNRGVGYLKDGSVTWYRADDTPAAIPNDYVQAIEIDKNGNVWFGSFGGVTKYDGVSWKTWTKADGLPASSVNTIVFDNSGGVWLGFYPDGAGTQADPFTGGYAHLNAAGVIDFTKSYTAPYSETVGSSLLADAWVRGIAVDKDGGAWVVRSGSYADLPNVGGRVDYVDKDKKVTSYTGKELLGSSLTVTASNNPEIRMVTLDKNGGIWFATSGGGLFHCASPKNVFKVYSTANKSWPSGTPMDNIYFIKFIGDTLYIGGSGGIAWMENPVLAPPPAVVDPEDPKPGYIGDATATTAEFKITGAVAEPGYFTLGGLKSYPGVVGQTRKYNWLNNYGTEGSSLMTGVFLEDLLKNVMQLSAGAKSITVTASDGYYREFNLDSNELGVYWTDIDGNKLMLAWQEDTSPCNLKLVVGQSSKSHINRPMWVSDLVSITVNASTVSPGGGTSGKYENAEKPETQNPEPGQTVTQTIEANITVTNGTVNAGNTADEVRNALNALTSSAESQENTEKVVSVNAVSNQDTGKTVYTLQADALKVLADNGKTSLLLTTDQGSIELPAELLVSLNADGQGELVIEMTKSDASENGGLTAVDITITAGGKQVGTFDGVVVKADIPVTPEADMQGENLVVYHVSDSGEKTTIKLAAYNSGSKNMRVGLQHLSTYMVAYNPVSFTDTAGHWAQPDISFLAARSIVGGRAAGIFEPEGKVSRAEFLKMLAESVDGLVLTGAPNAGFSDVPSDAWYAVYVNWAASLGIAQGYPEGDFQPDGLITREQMAVMTDRFIQSVKLNLKTSSTAADFADQEKISSFAVSAIRKVQQLGIMNGNPDGTFNPQGTATRAEAARVIRTFIEALLR